MKKRFAPPLVHLVSLSLVLCVLLVPEAPAQVPPPPPPPTTTWQPAALLPLQVDPPEVMHVIAGSVITLTGPEILDEDTAEGVQVDDNEWTYALDIGDVGTLVDSDTSLSGAPPFFTWQAPTEAAVAEMTMTAWDVGNSPTCDPSTGTWTYEIHVHELEVYQIWGGLTMHAERDGEPVHAWHAGIDCGTGGAHWDNDPDSPLPRLLYDRDAGTGGPGLFAGQYAGALSLLVRAKDAYAGNVVSQSVRIRASWAAEGTSFQATVAVSQLPVTVFPAMASPIDAEVSLYESVTWDWQYDIPYGSLYQHSVSWGGDPTTDDWVATTHGWPDIAGQELTPTRVRTVCEAMQGASTPDQAAEAAQDFAGVEGDVAFGPWALPGADTVDAWCIKCRGALGTDCYSAARLASVACCIVGVSSVASRAYPREEWSDGLTGWQTQQTCFSGLPGHSPWSLGYTPGYQAGLPTPVYRFEGYFRPALGSAYYTVFPDTAYPDLATMITEQAAFGLANPPSALQDQGYVCLPPDHDPYPHGVYIYGVGLHEIPEPSPEGE